MNRRAFSDIARGGELFTSATEGLLLIGTSLVALGAIADRINSAFAAASPRLEQAARHGPFRRHRSSRMTGK